MTQAVPDPTVSEEPANSGKTKELKYILKLRKAAPNLGETLMSAGNYEAALQIFNKTIALQPNYVAAWYSQGDALANLKRYEEALLSFDRAIELKSDYCEAWTFRSVVLIHLERYTEALASCERALEIQPQHREAWLLKGAALQHLGRYKQAYICFDKASGQQRQSLKQTFAETARGIVQTLKTNFKPV